MSSAHTCASADDEVAGVRIPRTPMAIEAAEAARASLPRAITGHASRVFVLASLAAQLPARPAMPMRCTWPRCTRTWD